MNKASFKYWEVIKSFLTNMSMDSEASDIRFASLEEAVQMIESTAIDWKKNMKERRLRQGQRSRLR